MPGRASSWALVAEFKSTRLALAGVAAVDCAVAAWLCDKTGTERTNSSDAASTKNERLCFRFMNELLFEMRGEKNLGVVSALGTRHATTLAGGYNNTASHFDSSCDLGLTLATRRF